MTCSHVLHIIIITAFILSLVFNVLTIYTNYFVSRTFARNAKYTIGIFLMCKPICLGLALSLFLISGLSSILFSFSYFYAFFFEPELLYQTFENTDVLYGLEFVSIILGGTGVFLNYLKFKICK